jgi:hypothetical protein
MRKMTQKTLLKDIKLCIKEFKSIKLQYSLFYILCSVSCIYLKNEIVITNKSLWCIAFNDALSIIGALCAITAGVLLMRWQEEVITI